MAWISLVRIQSHDSDDDEVKREIYSRVSHYDLR